MCNPQRHPSTSLYTFEQDAQVFIGNGIIGAIERDGGVLMEPRSGAGIDRECFERHSAKHPVQIGGKQGIKDLAQSVIMHHRGGQVRWEEGQHAAFLQARPHFIQGTMVIENH
jgi:hypothetical protein